MKRYTTEELNNIFARIAPQPGLFVPLRPAPLSRRSGPAICVYLRYSEIVPGTRGVENQYWKTLQQTPVLGAVGALAVINSILSEHRAVDPNVHRAINERFLPPDLRTKVAQNELGGPGFVGVFTRIGGLQLIRHLILYGNRSVKTAGQRVDRLGELALLANEFIQFDPVQNPAQASSLDLLLLSLPTWDVYNPRDLAYALSRMFTILTEIGSSCGIRKARRKHFCNWPRPARRWRMAKSAPRQDLSGSTPYV